MRGRTISGQPRTGCRCFPIRRRGRNSRRAAPRSQPDALRRRRLLARRRVLGVSRRAPPSRRRGLVGAATLLGLVPVVGPIGYLLFRPPETRADAKARGIEVEALESWLRREPPHCPACRSGVEASFLVCPVCTTRLKEPCAGAPRRSARLARLPVLRARRRAPPVDDLDAALTAEAACRASGPPNGNGLASRSRPRPRDRE